MFGGARNLLAREKDGRVIVTFLSDDEAGGEWVQGEEWLSSLIPVRAEIARGDLRALYLGWLLCVQKDRLGGKETEPPVPAGLGQLSASLESLVEFLRIDSDLLAVAAQASSPLPKIEVDYQEITAWVERLPTGEKNDLLARLVLGENSSLAAVILRRFLEQREAALGHGGKPIKRRTVRRLLDAAEEYGAERLRIEAQKEAEEKALSEREAAAARARYLDELGGREPQLWAEVERLVMTKRPASYDEAVELLKDLRDLATRKQDSGFQLRFRSLRAILMRRPALMERMRNAGLKFS